MLEPESIIRCFVQYQVAQGDGNINNIPPIINRLNIDAEHWG